jgi:hypothetical protein
MGRTQKRARYSARTSQGAPFFSIPKQQPRLAGAEMASRRWRRGDGVAEMASPSRVVIPALEVRRKNHAPVRILTVTTRAQTLVNTYFPTRPHARTLPKHTRASREHQSRSLLRQYFSRGRPPTRRASTSLDPYCAEAFPRPPSHPRAPVSILTAKRLPRDRASTRRASTAASASLDPECTNAFREHAHASLRTSLDPDCANASPANSQAPVSILTAPTLSPRAATPTLRTSTSLDPDCARAFPEHAPKLHAHVPVSILTAPTLSPRTSPRFPQAPVSILTALTLCPRATTSRRSQSSVTQ